MKIFLYSIVIHSWVNLTKAFFMRTAKTETELMPRLI